MLQMHSVFCAVQIQPALHQQTMRYVGFTIGGRLIARVNVVFNFEGQWAVYDVIYCSCDVCSVNV